ncbi:MAG: hypothetical protein IIU52_05660, partial [Bacteroidaceae bacterium]|nr:hypothetical protein [Bacteroidaceae bacterium]
FPQQQFLSLFRLPESGFRAKMPGESQPDPKGENRTMRKIQLSDHFTWRTLLLFALPSIGMQLVDNTYQIADGYFISNYIGEAAFEAENLIFPPAAYISMGARDSCSDSLRMLSPLLQVFWQHTTFWVLVQ